MLSIVIGGWRTWRAHIQTKEGIPFQTLARKEWQRNGITWLDFNHYINCWGVWTLAFGYHTMWAIETQTTNTDKVIAVTGASF